MKLLIVSIIMFWFSGCATVNPPKSEYKLNSQMPTHVGSGVACGDKSLKVAEAFSSSTLMALNMNYVQGTNKQFAYAQAQWATAPNQAISAKLLELIRVSNLFQSVQVSKSRSKNDLILETNIEDFMQYYSEDFRDSYANVAMTLTLIDGNKNSVVATKTFHAKVLTKTADAEGGVVALDTALFDVLSQIDGWLGKVCQ